MVIDVLVEKKYTLFPREIMKMHFCTCTYTISVDISTSFDIQLHQFTTTTLYSVISCKFYVDVQSSTNFYNSVKWGIRQ